MKARDEGAVRRADGGDVVQDDAVERVDIVGASAVLQEFGPGELRGRGI